MGRFLENYILTGTIVSADCQTYKKSYEWQHPSKLCKLHSDNGVKIDASQPDSRC